MTLRITIVIGMSYSSKKNEILLKYCVGRDELMLDRTLINKQQIVNREKVVFFVKKGMDGFLGDILQGLSDIYEVKKITVTEFQQIDEGMKWADLAWFEWCDELVAYGSKLGLAKDKIIICRIHSYEAFTDYPNNVIWDNVDKLVFVAEHIRDFVVEKLQLEKSRTIVIPNGIDTSRYTFGERKPGFRIAYVGYINYKKGPMMLLHTFKAIYDKNNKYQLFIAGQFQDDRDILYFRQMIKEFGIEKNVIFDGWQDDLDLWLEDKNYILCTSVLESQNMSVMQAMAKGIKPVIHNFVGAKAIYSNYVWNTIEEAVSIIEDNNYHSREYHQFVEDHYSLVSVIDRLRELLHSMKDENILNYNPKESLKTMPLVTIGITNYNGKQYLSRCVKAFLDQTYPNIEILLIDDCSTDGSKELIQEYEMKFNHIKGMYHAKNSGGASKGIQEIIENAKGTYFQWIACDDYVENNSVEVFVNYLEENTDKDYVYSNFNIIDENEVRTEKWEYITLKKEAVIQHIFETGSGIIPMNCMNRKSFFDKNQVNWIIYHDNDFSADTLNTLHYIKHNWNYGRIDKALINYRIHKSNASHNVEQRINASVALYDYVIHNFKEEVFLPLIDWKKETDREQLKMLCIAQFFYVQIQNHINMSAIPAYLRHNLTKVQIGKFCIVYAKEGLTYVRRGLLLGDKYRNEIETMKNVFEKFLEETSINDPIEITT